MISSNGLRRLGFVPDKDFVMRDDGGGSYIEDWRSSSDRPTMADMEAAHTEWQAEHDAQAYAHKRKAEYPSVDELVVALWESVVEERTAAVIKLEAQRQAVKTKHPK